jgi:hypothetical protein
VLFTDESRGWLGGNHSMLWRQRVETGPDVEIPTPKSGKNILIFSDTSLRCKTDLIFIDERPIDGETYVDD